MLEVTTTKRFELNTFKVDDEQFVRSNVVVQRNWELSEVCYEYVSDSTAFLIVTCDVDCSVTKFRDVTFLFRTNDNDVI